MIERGLTDVNLVTDDPRVRARTMRAFDEAAVSSSYDLSVAPGEMVLVGTGTRFHNERYELLSFPAAAATGRWVKNIRIPRVWRRGMVRFTILYSGSTASTNNIRWRLLANAHGLGQDVGGAVDLTEDKVAPGPAALTNLLAMSFDTWLPINSEDRILGVHLMRNLGAPDTYAGDAYVFMIEVDFFPLKGSAA